VDVNGRNALESFGDIPGVQVMSDLNISEHGVWIPYRKDPETTLSMIGAAQKMIFEGKAPSVVFMHVGVEGSWMNDLIQDTDGISFDALQGFKLTVTGHYHRHQVMNHSEGQVVYVGSQWQTTASEAGQSKSLGRLRDGVYTPIPVNWGPKYHAMKLDKDSAIVTEGIGKDDAIRIKMQGEDARTQAEALGKSLAKDGFTNVVITPEVAPMQNRLVIDTNTTLNGYAKGYAEQVETELDRERLMKSFEFIMGGAAQ
jgi:hypothetical protein